MNLYPFQQEGVRELQKHHYFLLADEMGLGKSAQALAVAVSKNMQTLVVCPAFLVPNWQEEITKWVPKELKPLFKVISYSSLGKNKKAFQDAKIVIADECHYIKNYNAKRTKYFVSYVENFLPVRLILLSGTPIKNRIPELFTSLYLISLNPRGTSGEPLRLNYWQFCKHFSNEKRINVGGRSITKFEGHRNLEHLRDLLKGKFLRRRAAEVLDLPALNRIDHPIGKELHEEELLNAWEDYEQGNKKSFSSAKTVNAIAKAKHTVELAKDLMEQGESVLIFTDHVKSAEKIAEGLGKCAGLIHGGVSIERRQNIMGEFKHEKLTALVATIGTLSTGVTLTNCRYMIFNDLNWTVADNLQAEKRIHRIGQNKTCFIYRVIAGNVDRMIVNTITKKMDLLSRTIDWEAHGGQTQQDEGTFL